MRWSSWDPKLCVIGFPPVRYMLKLHFAVACCVGGTIVILCEYDSKVSKISKSGPTVPLVPQCSANPQSFDIS